MAAIMQLVRRDFKELGFVAIATVHENNLSVAFTVYEIEGVEAGGRILFHKKDADSSPDPVDSIEESEAYLHGYVKWDGCCNWYFDEQDRVMLHFCTREELLNLGTFHDYSLDACEKGGLC